MSPSDTASGGWVELLPGVAGREVVLHDTTNGRAHERLVAAGARVVGLGASGPSAAVVVLAGAAGPDLLDAAAQALAPDGLLLVVLANPASPLAWLDAGRGREPRPGRRPAAVRRDLARRGLGAQTSYGILRSLSSSSTLFDLGGRRSRRRCSLPATR